MKIFFKNKSSLYCIHDTFNNAAYKTADINQQELTTSETLQKTEQELSLIEEMRRVYLKMEDQPPIRNWSF